MAPAKEYTFYTTPTRKWYSDFPGVYGDYTVVDTPPPDPDNRDSLVYGEYDPRDFVGPIPGTTFQVNNSASTIPLSSSLTGWDFRNTIIPQVRNLTLRNCILRGSPSGGAAIQGNSALGGGCGGITLIDCQLIQQGSNNSSNAASNGDYHFKRCEINGWVDGISLGGPFSGSSVEGCWIHNGRWGLQPAQPDGQTHNDAIQFHRGKNILIRGNYLGGTRVGGKLPSDAQKASNDDYNNACIMLQQEVGTALADKLENVVIDKNWFNGGASGINMTVKNGNNGATWSITNNRFIRRPEPVGNTNGWYILRNGISATITGNVYDDTGLPIPLS